MCVFSSCNISLTYICQKKSMSRLLSQTAAQRKRTNRQWSRGHQRPQTHKKYLTQVSLSMCQSCKITTQRFTFHRIRTYWENTTFSLTFLASVWPWNKVKVIKLVWLWTGQWGSTMLSLRDSSRKISNMTSFSPSTAFITLPSKPTHKPMHFKLKCIVELRNYCYMAHQKNNIICWNWKQ